MNQSLSLIGAARDVATFMLKGNQLKLESGVPTPVHFPMPKHTYQLREKLLTEEWEEFRIELWSLPWAEDTRDRTVNPNDIIDIYRGTLHEAMDVIVVLLGTLLAAGFTPEMIDDAWTEVMRANLHKVRDGFRTNSDGKIIKPDDWTPANLLPIITNHGLTARIEAAFPDTHSNGDTTDGD